MQRLYSFREAANLIPSPQGGTVSPITLYRWRKEGRLTAVCRPGKKRDSWFLTQAEILRLRGESEVVHTETPISPAKQARLAEAEVNAFYARLKRAAPAGGARATRPQRAG